MNTKIDNQQEDASVEIYLTLWWGTYSISIRYFSALSTITRSARHHSGCAPGWNNCTTHRTPEIPQCTISIYCSAGCIRPRMRLYSTAMVSPWVVILYVILTAQMFPIADGLYTTVRGEIDSLRLANLFCWASHQQKVFPNPS
jgi:hypothetical protein